jgi:hypothetical protein
MGRLRSSRSGLRVTARPSRECRSTRETTTRRSCSAMLRKRSIPSSRSAGGCSTRWPPSAQVQLPPPVNHQVSAARSSRTRDREPTQVPRRAVHMKASCVMWVVCVFSVKCQGSSAGIPDACSLVEITARHAGSSLTRPRSSSCLVTSRRMASARHLLAAPRAADYEKHAQPQHVPDVQRCLALLPGNARMALGIPRMS